MGKKPDFSVQYIYRKRKAGFHSIESVFDVLADALGAEISVKKFEVPCPGAGPGSVCKNLWQYRRAAGEGGRSGLSHITGHVNYMALRTGRRTVLTVHDMGSALQGNPLARFLKLVFWFWIPCWIVGRITVISEFSLEELCRLVPFVGRKARVVSNPVHPDFSYNPSPDRKPGEKTRVLLVGTKANKNLDRTVEALKGLSVSLVIIGKLSVSQQKFLHTSGLEFSNHWNLSGEELVHCYREADLLCFASLYEGFGMPIIEAQATGRPVVTSNRGAMKEVAGLGAHLVDPEDVASIRKGVLKLIEDRACRDLLVEKGRENEKRFAAEKVANNYMEVYKEILHAR